MAGKLKLKNKSHEMGLHRIEEKPMKSKGILSPNTFNERCVNDESEVLFPEDPDSIKRLCGHG